MGNVLIEDAETINRDICVSNNIFPVVQPKDEPFFNKHGIKIETITSWENIHFKKLLTVDVPEPNTWEIDHLRKIILPEGYQLVADPTNHRVYRLKDQNGIELCDVFTKLPGYDNEIYYAFHEN